MHRSMRALTFALLALSLLGPRPAHAEDAAVAAIPGIRGEMIASLQDAGGKIQELAGAIPAGKYTWAPAKGVRTVAEVFLHVTFANEFIPSMMGATPPIPTNDLMALEKSTTDKAKIADLLKSSYAFMQKVLTDTPDSDLDTMVEFFGQKMTKRAGYLIIVSHSHEHLGQSIAYARSLGITPPWTARDQAAAAKKEAEKKMETPKK